MTFSPRINLFTGANAAGKTSLLEAIHCLVRTRSFRTRRLPRLVREGAEGFQLVAEVGLGNGVEVPVGVGYRAPQIQIRVNREPVRRLSDLAGLFPLQLIAGNIHQLIEDGPMYRRRFLDWGLFHVEQAYADIWRRYYRILKHRNAALRQNAPLSLLNTWSDELIQAAEQVNAFRAAYLTKLCTELNEVVGPLLQTDRRIELVYEPGAITGRSLEESLQQQIDRDRKQGTTHSGPHRADIRFEYQGEDLVSRLSRGRQKLLVIAMQLAQARLVPREAAATSLILLDDLGAELDSANQQRVFEELVRTDAQVFMTSIQAEPWYRNIPTDLSAMFHVERGTLTRMV